MAAEVSAIKFGRQHGLLEEKRIQNHPQPETVSPMPHNQDNEPREPENFESDDVRGLKLPAIMVISIIVFMAGIAISGMVFAWNASSQWTKMNSSLDDVKTLIAQSAKDSHAEMETRVTAIETAEDVKIAALALQVQQASIKSGDRMTRQDMMIWILKAQRANTTNTVVFPDVPEHTTP